MTAVIWLMYLADLAESVSTLLVLLGVFTLITVGGYKFCTGMEDDWRPREEPRAKVRGYVIASLVAFAVATVIPSKTTLYAAAAVTAGDKALETPTGDKAIRALNAWLDRQITDDGKGE